MGHDGLHSGRSGVVGPSGSTVGVAWRYVSSVGTMTTCMVSSDGMAYAGNTNGSVFSVVNGTLLWWTWLGATSLVPGLNVGLSVDESSVYVGSTDGAVRSLDRLSGSVVVS